MITLLLSYQISKFDPLTSVDSSILDGGTIPRPDMLASYPQMPDESDSSTPPPTPRRRIRCKMCRHELAAREHMFDHGQLGPLTSTRTTSTTSKKLSEMQGNEQGSLETLAIVKSTEADATSINEKFKHETMSAGVVRRSSEVEKPRRSLSELGGLTDSSPVLSPAVEESGGGGGATDDSQQTHDQLESVKLLGQKLSDAVITPVSKSNEEIGASSRSDNRGEKIGEGPSTTGASEAQGTRITNLPSPHNFTAQLSADPRLAALRSPSSGSPASSLSHTPLSPISPKPKAFAVSPPIIVNPKCSGYFVEPVRSLISHL